MIAMIKEDSRSVSEAMHVIGNVKDKHAVLVDDMVDFEVHCVMRQKYYWPCCFKHPYILHMEY